MFPVWGLAEGHGTPLQNQDMDLYSFVRHLRSISYTLWKHQDANTSAQSKDQMILVMKATVPQKNKDARILWIEYRNVPQVSYSRVKESLRSQLHLFKITFDKVGNDGAYSTAAHGGGAHLPPIGPLSLW